MLPKAVLRPAPRGGKNNRNASEEHTKKLCSRWLAGERMSLWRECSDLPPAKKRKRLEAESDNSASAKTLERCFKLVEEGRYAAACRVLSSVPPVSVTAEVCAEMRSKHPRAPAPDLNTLPPVPLNSAIQFDHAAVNRMKGTFPRVLVQARLASAPNT